MNNRFKFRICYTAQNGSKSLIYSDDKRYLITLDGKVLENYGKDWKNPFWEEVFDADEQPIIQQYTGLTDKNKKEIYECDILEFTARYKQTGPSPVIYYGSSFGCVVTDDGGLKEFWDLSHIVQQHYPEIIGNISENPELLK